MADDRDDELDPSDWLASQFDPTGAVELPKRAAKPADPDAPTDPLAPGAPGAPGAPELPGAPAAPVSPFGPPPIVPPAPAVPSAPPFSPPPIVPATPTALPTTPFELPLAPPPVAPFPTEGAPTPTPPPAGPPPGQPFMWGLTPGAPIDSGPGPQAFPQDPDVPPTPGVPSSDLPPTPGFPPPLFPSEPQQPIAPPLFPAAPQPPAAPEPPATPAFPVDPVPPASPPPVYPPQPVAPEPILPPAPATPTPPLAFPSADQLGEQFGMTPAASEVPPAFPPAPDVPPAFLPQPDLPPVLPPAPDLTSAFPPTVAMPVEPGAPAFPFEPPTAAFPPAPTAPFSPPALQEPGQHDPHVGQLPWEAPPALDDALEGATEVFAPQAVGLAEPEGEAAPASALDSLFGETQFREYEDTLMPTLPPVGGNGDVNDGVPPAKKPRGPLSKTTKILIWVAAGLAAALVLVVLFLAGTRLSALIPAAPTASPSPTPSPSPTAAPIGPVAPGVYLYDELLGGECLEPFDSAWEAEYTVIDCATPHTGQLVHVGAFTDKAHADFPGVEELQKRIAILCTPATIIDYAVAGTMPDLQVSASFAPDATEWVSGNRTYYCFVNRAANAPITGSVAVPQVPVPVAPAP